MPSKRKGMRRAHLKRFSSQMINGGQGVDKRYIDQFKNNRGSMGRVKQGPIIEVDSVGKPILPGIAHPHDMPVPRGHVTDSGVYISSKSPERVRVEERLRQERSKEIPTAPVLHVLWQAHERGQRYEDFVRVLKKNGKYTQIYWYFSGERSFFMRVTPWDIATSYMYTRRFLAERAFVLDQISWMQNLPIS